MVKIVVTDKKHIKYAQLICSTMEESARIRKTGLAKRDVNEIIEKITKRDAVIALDGDNFVGFCYLKIWGEGKFIVHSGLIVHPNYRRQGVAKKMKKKLFDYTRSIYPNAKIFGITTGLPTMKLNTSLGYKPVTFSELPQDDGFWAGCKSCANYHILESKKRTMCLCTGLLYTPEKEGWVKKLKNKILKFFFK